MRGKSRYFGFKSKLVLAVGLLPVLVPMVGGTAASATATAPPFEPDPYAASPYSSVIFYDAQGNEVTSGSDMTAPFAYAVAVSNGEALSTKGFLAFAKPEMGVDESNWPATAEAGPTTFSPATSLPAGTPADIAAYAPTHPIVATPTANLGTFFSANGTDSNAGYQDTAEVRLTDNKTPAGSYWESDVAFNPTASTITVDGVSIPSGGWAQVFPVVTPSSISLQASPASPQSAGTQVTLTATVPSSDPGTVQFFDNGTFLGSSAQSGGTATWQDTPTQGTHSYTATFVPTLGDETNAGTANATIVGGSTSTAVPYTVSAAATATNTSLAADHNPSVVGQQVTYTASVTPTPDAGTVTFFDDTSGTPTAVCTAVAVTAGVATCHDTFSTAGSDTIYATYNGDASFKTSTSSNLTQTVNAADTTTDLSASPNPAGVNQNVTLTATVSANTPGGGTPSGQVDFENNGAAISGCTGLALVSGTVTCTTSFSSTGAVPLSAVFTDPNGNYNTSTGDVSPPFQVNPATTTGVVTSKTPTVYGEKPTFTATVSVVSPGTGNPDGTVSFKYAVGASTQTLCSGSTLAAAAGNTSTADCTPTGALPLGAGTVTATYSGSSSFGGSSGTVGQTVNQADTTTSVTGGTPDPSVFGQSVTYSATVAATAPGAGTPTGTVHFFDGATSLCSATLSNGTASCGSKAAAPGSQMITATYAGDTNFNGSTDSTGVSQTVNDASTKTTLTGSPNPALTNADVTYTATVAVTGAGSGTPTGTVSFNDSVSGAITNCDAVALTAGKATCTTTYAAAGNYSVTAVFTAGGGSGFAGSSSSAYGEAVIAPTAPSAPRGLTAVAGDGRVTLSWTPPASNGRSAIQGYDLFVGTASSGESATPVNHALITATHFTVTGLTNKTEYFFTVEAVNAVGASAPSNQAEATPSQPAGFWMAGDDGGVFGFGGAGFFGSLGNVHLSAPIVGIAHTPDHAGYWLLGSDGGVFGFGDAHFYGSLGGLKLDAPIVAIVPTPTGKGYWLVGRDGGVFGFGDAGFHGSLGGIHLVQPIVSMISTTDGKGYMMVAADGGVFGFGDAHFYGSLGGMKIDAPIVGIVPAPDGNGYTLAGADGGIYAFGHGPYHGSLGGLHLARPIVSIIPTSDGGGYWLIGDDGGTFAFGDAHYAGSLPALHVVVSNIIGGA